MMGWVVLAWLTLAAGVAALSLAMRLRPDTRAELFLGSGLLWNLLIVTPIYVLGFAHSLTATRLAIASALLFHGILAFHFLERGRRGAKRQALDLAAALVDLIVLPFEAIGLAKRERSLVVLPLALCTWLILWTAIGSYFTPSWRQWDSLWYHETIVGFTIQEHGFSVIPLPGDPQKVNGYPRLCEMTHLWFVIFTDRRLIELTNSLIASPLMMSVYLLTRRFGTKPLAAMALSAIVLLIPACANLLESTYIDPQVALFLLGATFYSTRPVFRRSDAIMTIVCLMLAIGSKFLVLPNVGILAIIALVRLFKHHGFHKRSFGVTLLGAVVIGGMAASVYGRNWIAFHNPFWPDLNYDNPKYGIHWVGNNPAGENLVDMNIPLSDLIDTLVAVPYSIKGLGPKTQLYDYGFMVIWIVFPLGFLAAFLTAVYCARSGIGRLIRYTFGPSTLFRDWISEDNENAFLIWLPAFAGIYLSPALWGPRYHIAHVGVLLVLIAWLGKRASGAVTSLAHDVAIACSVAAVIAFFWDQPRWWYTPTEMRKLASIHYPEREVTIASSISPNLFIAAGSAIATNVGIKRELSLGPGSVVAFNDRVQFIALLWNNDFSNRVIWIPDGPNFVDRLMASNAIWFYCRNGDPSCSELRTRGWKDVGTYNVESWGVIMRRYQW